MLDQIPGVPFHGEFTSADATALSEANSRFTLYGAGSATALTLATTDQVIITDIQVATGTAAMSVTVYDSAGTDDATVDAGEKVVVFRQQSAAGSGTHFQQLVTPHYCKKGTYPKVKGSAAGQIDAFIHGTIIRIGS